MHPPIAVIAASLVWLQACAVDPRAAPADGGLADASPETTFESTEQAAAATLVWVNAGTGAIAAGAASACFASGACIAIVIVGVIVVGGIAYLALRANDRAALTSSASFEVRRGSTRVRATLEASTVGPLADYLNQGITWGPRRDLVTTYNYVIATRYVDFCQGPRVRGGAACVSQARSYLSCVSYAGGDACLARLHGRVVATIVEIPGASGQVERDLERMREALRDLGDGHLASRIGRNGGQREGCVVTEVEVPQIGIIDGRGRFNTPEMAPVAWFESFARAFGKCAYVHTVNRSPMWRGQSVGAIGHVPVGDPFLGLQTGVHCWYRGSEIRPVAACGDQPMLNAAR